MDALIPKDRMSVRHFHSTKRFIDDLCAIDDGNLFKRVHCEIYTDELELKKEQSENYATFLNLDITIQEGELMYKLFDNQDVFLFQLYTCHIFIAIFQRVSSILLWLESSLGKHVRHCLKKTFWIKLEHCVSECLNKVLRKSRSNSAFAKS